MANRLFRVKPVEPAPHVDAGEPIEGSLEGEATLKRTLTARHLVLLGIGAVIGAGIFVLTGQAAAFHAGPAVTLSFVFAGLACALAGLCYAEFAAMIPVSGGAYSYSYATLGEGMAWFIGWCLVLEYLFAAVSSALSPQPSTCRSRRRCPPRHWRGPGMNLSPPASCSTCLRS